MNPIEAKIMNFKISILFLALVFQISQITHAQIANGIWSTKCINGQQKLQVYSDKLVVLIEQFYSDSQCLNESIRFETTGTINYSHENSSFIDFKYEAIHVTFFKQDIIDDFNNRKVCGLAEWKLAHAQNITGRRCAIFNLHKETQIPQTGDRKYGIYSIENAKLYYGQLTKNLDGSSPEKRPTQINTSLEYFFEK